MQSPASRAWSKSGIAAFAVAILTVGCTAATDNGGGGSSGGAGGSGGQQTGGAGGNAGSGGSNNGGAGSGGSKNGGATSNGGAGSGGSNNGGAGSGGDGSGGATSTGGSTAPPCTENSCPGGQVCEDGVCKCPADYALCGGVCLSKTDILTNPAHCGTSGCGVACPNTATCEEGACKCPDGKTVCGTACADLQTDAKNCGKCGTSCPSGTCEAGVCRKVKDCFVKTVIATPLVADFEGYDGTTATDAWGWAFNGAPGSANAVYAGLYNSNDGTGSPKLTIAGPGYDGSKYAAGISNSAASAWGGQIGMWMGCVDASAYQGISFWVQGTVPGTATLAIATEDTSAPDDTGAGGGTCTSTGDTCKPAEVEFPVSSTWSQVLVAWDTFKPGTANGADVPLTGDKITGMSWTAALEWTANGDAGYVPVPGSYSLSVDNVEFVTATECTGSRKLCGTGGCVDTNTNNSHCGECDHACTNSRTCQAGSCVCPSGYTDCSGECVNLQIDAQNCGGCGKSCTGMCSGGACQESTCKADMPQQGKTSTAGASITLGKYWINNNQWGASGGSGSQSIWSTCSSGNTIGWGTEWNWSGGAGQVKSYASSVLGWHWGWKVSGSGLPVQLSSNKNITCGWTYRVQPGQTINVSYDLFAHTKSDPGTNDDPSDEIMVWLYRSGGAAPIGDPVATVSIAGTNWEFHQGSNGRWMVHSYVRTSNADTGATLNLMDFLKDLTSKRGLSSSKYLSSIQSGTEVFLGNGRLDTDQYYCTIQ